MSTKSQTESGPEQPTAILSSEWLAVANAAVQLLEGRFYCELNTYEIALYRTLSQLTPKRVRINAHGMVRRWPG